MGTSVDKTALLSRWYFGGVASSMAACCTHPLDLLKVHLQTQKEGRLGIGGMAVKVIKSDGVLGLYSGLSASLLRQLTYSTTRFGMYESIKASLGQEKGPLPFHQKVALAAVSGACGGLVGTPGDMVNVRMQNDVKLPPEQRRLYKHAIDGLIRVAREEGLAKLFSGASMATSRAVLMTIGQVAFYDQFKQVLLATGLFSDNLVTHFTASSSAATVAVAMTQPLDVMKTRLMNAAPGEFNSIFHCFSTTLREGPSAFYKGFVPAFVRLAPQTVLTWIFLEQIRQNFGYLPQPKKQD